MLPFLMARKQGSVAAVAKKDGSIEVTNEEGEASPEIMAIAEELMSGIAMKDSKKVAGALQAVMEMGSIPEMDEK